MSVVLEGARLSELARCPRMASFRALGAQPADIDVEWQRYFARGNLFEFYVYQQYAAEHGKSNVQRQVVIPWPLGEGHADLFIVPRAELVEVKSSATPHSMDLLETATRQLRLYKHYYPAAKKAGLYIVNPSNLRQEDYYPVKTSKGDEEEIVHLVGLVQRAVETGGEELPACVCDSPGACRQMGCAFTEQAWEGWEPPQGHTLDDAEAAAFAQTLYELKSEYRRFQAEADERKEGYALAQAALRSLGVEPGRDYLVGPYKLRRIVTSPSESFSLAKAKQTGNWTEGDYERLGAFVSLRSGSERWSIERVSDEVTPEDFGDEAPF